MTDYRIATEEDRMKLGRLLRKCVEANQPMRVTVVKWKKKRSLSQNSYYHAVVKKEIADYSGHTEDEMHEILKQMFCPTKAIRFGEKEYLIRSTRNLSTVEMRDYIDQCVAFAATELALAIPDPC